MSKTILIIFLIVLSGATLIGPNICDTKLRKKQHIIDSLTVECRIKDSVLNISYAYYWRLEKVCKKDRVITDSLYHTSNTRIDKLQRVLHRTKDTLEDYKFKLDVIENDKN